MFRSRPFVGNFAVSGVTKDSSGAALANCQVTLLKSADLSVVATGTSDGSGNYRLPTPTNSDRYQVLSYKNGSPDVAGVTVNTLTAS
jgi:hypothetical protein